MTNIKCFLLLIVLFLNFSSAAYVQINEEIQEPGKFNTRAGMIVDSLADWAKSFTLDEFKASDNYDGGKYGAYPIMALFERGYIDKAREFVAQQLIGGAAMFREYSTMALYMEYHHLYGDELCNKVKADQLKSNFFNFEAKTYKEDISQSHRNSRLGGASENHKLMYAVAAYLAGIAWPDEYPKEWYEIGYDHLMKWFSTITSIGFWEEDSPTYLIHHMGPILSIAEHAPVNSEMKKRAGMVLDWYFLSIAGEYLHGYWITSSARDYNPLFGLNSSAETTSLMWLFFGDAPDIPNPHIHQPFRHWKAAVHFAVSDYRIPDIILKIATERDEAFVHKEFMAKNPMLPKEYCYLNKIYGMASIVEETGRKAPDMTRWKVQWVRHDMLKEPSTFFMKHPALDEKWEGWRGASKAEQVIQYKDALLAVYNIGEDQMPYIDGPFCKSSFEAVLEKEDWVFLHAGSVLLGVKALKGLKIENERPVYNDRWPYSEIGTIRSKGQKNGLIVQCGLPGDYDNGMDPVTTLNNFVVDILANTTVQYSLEDLPQIRYKSLSGDILEIQFDKYKRVNKKKPDFEHWPLLSNPWVNQEVNGKYLKINDDGHKIIYDFEKWEIKTD